MADEPNPAEPNKVNPGTPTPGKEGGSAQVPHTEGSERDTAAGEAGPGEVPDLDPNQQANPPTQKVGLATHVSETRFGSTPAVLGGEMPEGAPVWEGGDPGEATKLQDDTPEDYYWPKGGDAQPLVDPKDDSNADGVADGVVLDDVVNAAYPPGEPDPTVLSQTDGKPHDTHTATPQQRPEPDEPVDDDDTPATADPLGGDDEDDEEAD